MTFRGGCSALALAATLGLALSALSAPANNIMTDAQRVTFESAKANAFFDRAFEERVARSPMTKAQLGLKEDNDKWDDLSDAHALQDLTLKAQQLEELRQTVDPAHLDRQTRISYRMFVDDSEQAIEGLKWRHYNYPLDQMSGLHTEAPAFLINFHPIDTADDARAYISRLRGMALMFDQLIEGMGIRAKENIVPPRFVFSLVIAAARDFIKGEPFDTSAGKCVLLEDFERKVALLTSLDDATRARLVADARTALVEVVKPAYERLISALQEQEATASEDDGVWKFPGGLDYYSYALREATTTRMTADEIHELGLREVARIHHEMEEVMARVGFKGDLNAFFKFVREDPRFYYPTTSEGKAAYLARTNQIIDAMRSRLGEFFLNTPKAALIVKTVEPFREEGAPGAFYEEPSPDGSRPGVYYVNTVDMHGLPIFEMETLAHHEAIPGHHMQIAMAQELTGLPKFRRFDGNTAYVEGWALYCEYFPREFGFYADPYMDFGRLFDELLRAVRLVVDTGIHAKRWTREETMDYFRRNTPNSERDIVTETNRYIVLPAQAVAYKIGMIKILELRELAKKDLGPKFDLREFHDVVLRDGAVPLNILEENVRAWIASRKR